jgi:hypothetical protein
LRRSPRGVTLTAEGKLFLQQVPGQVHVLPTSPGTERGSY